MNLLNADQPTFPLARPIDETLPNIGLTKREYFAVMALQGLINGYAYAGETQFLNPEKTSQTAIRFADELLKQLEL